MSPTARSSIAALLLVVVTILPSFAAEDAPAPDAIEIVAGPYLQQGSQTSQTIMWETNRPSTSTVEFGLAAPLSASVSVEGQRAIHEVTVTNLEAETSYFYRVLSQNGNGEQVTSDLLTFETAVRPDSAFAYVVMGDSRTYPDRFAKIATLAFAERPNFALHVGDVVSDGNVKEQWVDEYLRPALPLMSRVPLYVAIGNHEHNAHWFYDYHSYPSPENYYSFDFGNAHFAMVDTNQDYSPGSAQYQWLETDLAQSKARWKFVAHHHPPYSSDNDDYGNTHAGQPSVIGDVKARQLVPLYEKYGVDIVWVGHIHDYERTWPVREGKAVEQGGVIYIQAGGGGAELEDFAPTRSWFTAKAMRGWQYCLVAVHGGALHMTAYDIDGRLYDLLDISK